jgi:hypothetical protein
MNPGHRYAPFPSTTWTLGCRGEDSEGEGIVVKGIVVRGIGPKPLIFSPDTANQDRPVTEPPRTSRTLVNSNSIVRLIILPPVVDRVWRQPPRLRRDPNAAPTW